MSEREWRFYLDDMIGFVEKAMAYSQGFDQAKFESSGLNYDATVRNLELIGEAAGHIPESIRSAHPAIPLAAGLCDPQPADTWVSRGRPFRQWRCGKNRART